MDRKAFYKSEGWDKLYALVSEYDDGENIIDGLIELEDYVKHLRAERDVQAALLKKLLPLLRLLQGEIEKGFVAHDVLRLVDEAEDALDKLDAALAASTGDEAGPARR